MSAERHAAVKALFLAALEREGSAREAFLATLEAGERREVEELLAHSDGPSTGPAPRLAVGQVVAERYRIEALIGRGGVGEVYRAQDLVLGGPVALKLIHGRSGANAETLRNEVRLARQITHPAVCRVHDVVLAEGELVLAMEWIDGEDLAAHLARAGSLPPAVVLELARQLCGGLAAAHARGILHRDLKPANVLLDRQGRAHLTDFGLAVSGSAVPGLAGGTPSYMAPELLLAGGHASEQSDLYALGLVLHELLTGAPALPAERAFALRRAPLPAPSSLVAGVDPALDAVIRAATDPDPRRRPASALAMAAALPGGDALGLALAIGGTASPALVAAAGEEAPVLRGWASHAWLGALMLSLGLFVGLGSRAWEQAVPRLGPGPEALDRALEPTLAAFGLADGAGRGDRGFVDNPAALELPRAILYWRRFELPAAGLRFVEELERSSHETEVGLAPPTGSVLVMTDLLGRLVHLEVARPLAAGTPGTLDWAPAIRAAGLDPAALAPAEAPLPEVFAGARSVWQGVHEGNPVRVQAASSNGQPLLFRAALGAELEPVTPPAVTGREALRVAILVAFLLGLPLVALVLGLGNLRRQRADRPGARRVALAVALPMALAALLSVGHAPTPNGLEGAPWLGTIVFSALAAWACYVGFEPWVRRFQPRWLIAWVRLLAGRVRDRQVGASLLVGTVVGVGCAVVDQLDRLLCRAFELVPQYPPILAEQLTPLTAPRLLLASLLARSADALTVVIPLVLVVALVQRWLPRRVSGVAAFLALSALCWGLIANSPLLSLALGVPVTALLVQWTLQRHGLLALSVAVLVGFLLSGSPMTLTLDAWHARGTWLALGSTLGLGWLGFLLARAARPESSAVLLGS